MNNSEKLQPDQRAYFERLCAECNILPTRRQLSKYLNRKGAAYAKHCEKSRRAK